MAHPYPHHRNFLACGVLAPVIAFAATLAAMLAYPGFDQSRQYISELGGAKAQAPWIFNGGVLLAGLMAGLAGAGFGLAIWTLTRARVTAVITVIVFALAGYGLVQAAIYVWPDRRHMAINLALGIQLAPLLLLWGLRARKDVAGLKIFLVVVFIAMAILTVLTKHLLFKGLVNDANVGWWERGYAIVLVGWVGVAAFLLERRLFTEPCAEKAS